MFYPENNKPQLDPITFLNPPCEYRAAPFWAWNCELDEDQLLREIEQLKRMGMGGFHMHVRTGMATPYLSDEFMQLIRACTDKAKKEKMLAYLYDEDRYASGPAGGFVTRDKQYRERYLLFTPDENVQLSEDGRLIARYGVSLNAAGELDAYRRLGKKDEAAPGETVWTAYLELAKEDPWFNNQTYVNCLDKKAIDRFV